MGSLLATEIIIKRSMIHTSDHRRIVELISLVLHHVHELLLRQTVIYLVPRLVRVIQHLGSLAKLFGSFSFRT